MERQIGWYKRTIYWKTVHEASAYTYRSIGSHSLKCEAMLQQAFVCKSASQSFSIFVVEIDVANYGYNRNKYRCYDGSHNFSSFTFLFSFTNNKPMMRVSVAPDITIPMTKGESISPKTDDNTSAVVMYFAISINHLPNSFFTMQ